MKKKAILLRNDRHEWTYYYYTKLEELSSEFKNRKIKIGDNVIIGLFTYIGDNVTIGDYARTGSHVHIDDDCYIGNQVEIDARTRIDGSSIICDGIEIGHDVIVTYESTVDSDINNYGLVLDGKVISRNLNQ